MLAALPEHERRAIAMALYHGLSCRQVAWALEEPEAVVKGWIRSGLRRMRSELDRVEGLGPRLQAGAAPGPSLDLVRRHGDGANPVTCR